MKTLYAGIFLLVAGLWLTGCATGAPRQAGSGFERGTAFDGGHLLIQGKVWDVGSGELVRDFSPVDSNTNSDRPKFLGPYVAANALSPDGRRAVIAQATVIGPEIVGPAPVEVWDIDTGRKRVEFQPEEIYPHAVQFSPDGKRILALLDTQANTNTLQLWDAEAGRLLQAWSGVWVSGSAPTWLDASFSPDGRQVTALSFEHIAVWDSATGKELVTLGRSGTNGFYTSVQFSPEGKRIVTDFVQLMPKTEKGVTTVWDAKTGAPLMTTTDDLGEGYGAIAMFTPDGRRIVSGARNGAVVMWDAGSGKELQRLQVAGKDFAITDRIFFSGDGKRMITGWDENSHQAGVIRHGALWEVESGKLIAEWKQDPGSVVVGFSTRDERFVMMKDGKPDRLMDGRTGEVIRNYQK